MADTEKRKQMAAKAAQDYVEAKRTLNELKEAEKEPKIDQESALCTMRDQMVALDAVVLVDRTVGKRFELFVRAGDWDGQTEIGAVYVGGE